MFPLPEESGMLSTDALPQILQRLKSVDAVLIGCGLGQSPGTCAVTQAVLANAQCPVILDADGINVLEGHIDILRGAACPVVLTPHEGEFLRLGGDVFSGEAVMLKHGGGSAAAPIARKVIKAYYGIE